MEEVLLSAKTKRRHVNRPEKAGGAEATGVASLDASAVFAIRSEQEEISLPVRAEAIDLKETARGVCAYHLTDLLPGCKTMSQHRTC